MRKIFSTLLLSVMVFSVTACGTPVPSQSSTADSSPSSEVFSALSSQSSEQISSENSTSSEIISTSEENSTSQFEDATISIPKIKKDEVICLGKISLTDAGFDYDIKMQEGSTLFLALDPTPNRTTPNDEWRYYFYSTFLTPYRVVGNEGTLNEPDLYVYVGATGADAVNVKGTISAYWLEKNF